MTESENETPLQSANGPEAVSESVNRAQGIIKHPDEEQLNPEDFRIDQSELDQPVTKTIQTNISVRKPAQLEFVRVHPGKDYRMGPVPFIALKQSKEFYIVDPALCGELRHREYWIGTVFLATNRLEKPFLWIVTTQSPTGRISDWYTSSLECAERAMEVSPLMRWSVLIEEYRSAIAALEAGDSSLIQVFENSRLGKVYAGRVDRIEPGELYARREVF
jgi:hypothetical protein